MLYFVNIIGGFLEQINQVIASLIQKDINVRTHTTRAHINAHTIIKFYSILGIKDS